MAKIGKPLSPERTSEPPSGSTTSTRSAKTVLIVEDDEAFAYAASRHLQQLGYQTIVTSGSFLAFDELDRHPVDIVIADVRLNPGEPHGIALGRMIRNRNQNMPVLVTAYPELLEAEKPLPGPALSKPVDLRLLASAVRAAIAA